MLKSNLPWVFAAPLCGYTSLPYRQILAKYSYDMMYTEMVSIDAIVYNNKETEQIYASSIDLTNVGVQIFGSKIEHFLLAVKKLSHLNRFQVFDINCGCPVSKVMKTGGGSALLKEPEKIFQIVQNLTREFPHLNITAKIRLGLNNKEKSYLEIAQAVQNGGAKLITVHGRTQTQIYSGDVDFQALKEIKQSLSIPVVGNGGIFTPEDAKYMIENTGVDGVMLARGIIGAPWLGQQVKDYLHTGTYSEPSDTDKIFLMREHYQKEASFCPDNGFREFKKSGIAYLKGMSHIKPWKIKLSLAQSPSEMQEILDELVNFHLKNPLI